ncbi:uncharacterized protein MELLADRAFT_67233 [Melampsora larici-populina 98AG31]|uniref:Uncharacterized protein n=1 Tax=Melampsora larici-populina (strain 98AG31 / pathotype 3-4-7) TaxID=747676 RepID=F4S2A7_MELLP|nr:uncharacterized protein MELLADRAFT_67233 [Melampsora larici-populina 98AG31]EGG01142.1 hypothetical protein MELLADRAFT_67233 [Melampsora larici-populina 98AG31]
MSGSNIPVKQSHTVTVSGVVENSAVLPPSDTRNYSYRSCTVAITCNGWNDDNKKEYDGKFTAYCSALEVPHVSECYVMKARFLANKDSADFNMYYEANHKIFVGTSKTFTGVLHNNTAISGLGVVSSRWNIPDEDDTKSTLCFVMKHVDYQPQLRKNQYFEIEYRIRPTRNMEKSQNIVQAGRETLITGFIVDWDSDHNRWIVEVTGVSPCTGNEGISSTKADPAGSITPAGWVRPAKHVPSSITSTNPTPGPSSTPASKRKLPIAEVPLKSPTPLARRTRPAKHVPKPLASATTKAVKAVPKGKGKASATVQSEPAPDALDKTISDKEWPVSPVQPPPKKTTTKKAPATKAKKAKPIPKLPEVEEEVIEDGNDVEEADTEDDMET